MDYMIILYNHDSSILVHLYFGSFWGKIFDTFLWLDSGGLPPSHSGLGDLAPKDELSRFLGDTTWQRTGLEAYHPSKTTIDMILP